ncbi:MAG: hypothetical protein ACUVXI_13630 [bacterium]
MRFEFSKIIPLGLAIASILVLATPSLAEVDLPEWGGGFRVAYRWQFQPGMDIFFFEPDAAVRIGKGFWISKGSLKTAFRNIPVGQTYHQVTIDPFYSANDSGISDYGSQSFGEYTRWDVVFDGGVFLSFDHRLEDFKYWAIREPLPRSPGYEGGITHSFGFALGDDARNGGWKGIGDDATEGFLGWAGVELADRTLRSTYSFTKIKGEWQQFFPMPGRHHTIAYRLASGFSLNPLPAYEKMGSTVHYNYSGEEYLVRGFLPKGRDGVVVGTLEYRFPIFLDHPGPALNFGGLRWGDVFIIKGGAVGTEFRYGMVMFADVGYGWDNDKIEWRTDRIQRSIGFGPTITLAPFIQLRGEVAVSDAFLYRPFLSLTISSGRVF